MKVKPDFIGFGKINIARKKYHLQVEGMLCKLSTQR
jgi:hypothetical protein